MASKYDPPYTNDLDKIMYVIREGLPFEDAHVKSSKQNLAFYEGLKKEVDELHAAGHEVLWT